MTERIYGNKYNDKLSTKEVAAAIRQDIKTAIAKGKLPAGLKVSVRYARFAGGSSIDASITTWPENFMWLNPDWVMLHKKQPHQYHEQVPRYTKQANAILDAIKALHDAYNHDGSDAMTDHFDVKYYDSVNVGWELERPEVERVYKMMNQGIRTQPARYRHG